MDDDEIGALALGNGAAGAPANALRDASALEDDPGSMAVPPASIPPNPVPPDDPNLIPGRVPDEPLS